MSSTLILTRPGVSVSVRPDLGARITSFVVDDHEWVAQPLCAHSPVPTGSAFVRDSIGGWDEMLPTISGEPDHGEVWTRAWTVELADDRRLITSVELRTLPLAFRRTIVLHEQHLSLDYRLTGTGSAPIPIPALWAAHPMLRGCEVRLPAHVTGVLDVMPHGAATRHPIWIPISEAALRLDRLPERGWAKYYVPFGVRVDRLEVVNDRGQILRWSWSDAVPYLGIWLDSGVFGPGAVVAPEPSTGAWDDLTHAAELGMVMQVAAGSTLTWSVEVTWDAAP